MGFYEREHSELLIKLLELSKDDAINVCKENNFVYRITREDKNYYPVTCDLNFNRVDLQLDKGFVSECSIG